MNVRDLRYLVALIDTRHFGRAAEACFVSQPALSMQIKKLEQSLGVQLLERSNKSVMITEIGELLGERARQVLQQVDEMKHLARQAADPFSGDLTLGIFPTLAPYLLPHITQKLRKKFPRVSFFLIEEQTAVLLDKLKTGKVDAAILALPVHEKGLVIAPLFSEDFYLAVPKQHDFAKRKSIQHKDLCDQDLLLLEDGHCMRDQALSLCSMVNAKEKQSFRATSLETLRHMVAAGIGMTLIPNLARKNNDGVHYLSFAKQAPQRDLGLVTRASSARKELLDGVAEVIKSVMA